MPVVVTLICQNLVVATHTLENVSNVCTTQREQNALHASKDTLEQPRMETAIVSLFKKVSIENA